jgi:hypothetical protein
VCFRAYAGENQEDMEVVVYNLNKNYGPHTRQSPLNTRHNHTIHAGVI